MWVRTKSHWSASGVVPHQQTLGVKRASTTPAKPSINNTTSTSTPFFFVPTLLLGYQMLSSSFFSFLFCRHQRHHRQLCKLISLASPVADVDINSSCSNRSVRFVHSSSSFSSLCSKYRYSSVVVVCSTNNTKSGAHFKYDLQNNGNSWMRQFCPVMKRKKKRNQLIEFQHHTHPLIRQLHQLPLLPYIFFPQSFVVFLDIVRCNTIRATPVCKCWLPLVADAWRGHLHFEVPFLQSPVASISAKWRRQRKPDLEMQML